MKERGLLPLPVAPPTNLRGVTSGTRPVLVSGGGAPGRTRTCDLEIRRLLLYPLSYGGMSPTVGAGDARSVEEQAAYRVAVALPHEAGRLDRPAEPRYLELFGAPG